MRQQCLPGIKLLFSCYLFPSGLIDNDVHQLWLSPAGDNKWAVTLYVLIVVIYQSSTSSCQEKKINKKINTKCRNNDTNHIHIHTTRNWLLWCYNRSNFFSRFDVFLHNTDVQWVKETQTYCIYCKSRTVRGRMLKITTTHLLSVHNNIESCKSWCLLLL